MNESDFYRIKTSGSDGVTDEGLRNIGETLWEMDINRMPDSGYTIDENGPQ